MSEFFKPEWFEKAQKPIPPKRYTAKVVRQTLRDDGKVELEFEIVGGPEDGARFVSVQG